MRLSYLKSALAQPDNPEGADKAIDPPRHA